MYAADFFFGGGGEVGKFPQILLKLCQFFVHTITIIVENLK